MSKGQKSAYMWVESACEVRQHRIFEQNLKAEKKERKLAREAENSEEREYTNENTWHYIIKVLWFV